MRLNRQTAFVFWYGAIAQLGERVLCKHEVVGSIPSGSTSKLACKPIRACSECELASHSSLKSEIERRQGWRFPMKYQFEDRVVLRGPQGSARRRSSMRGGESGLSADAISVSLSLARR